MGETHRSEDGNLFFQIHLKTEIHFSKNLNTLFSLIKYCDRASGPVAVGKRKYERALS